MAGTRRRRHALACGDDDVAFLPANDPSGVMPDPRLAPPLSGSTSVTTSTSTTTSSTGAAAEKRSGGLSVTQVCGGALAAVTAAVAASFLGVAGTLVGAAVGSVISTIAATLYSTSLNRAAKVSRTLGVKQTVVPAPTPAAPGEEQPAMPAGEPAAARPADVQGTGSVGSVWQRIHWRPVLLAAAGVFVAALAVISISELALGHPIANARESGTTLSNLGGSASDPSQPSTPTGTPTPSTSPSATPTPTSSAGTTDPGASPSPTAPSGTTSPAPASTAPTTAPSSTAPTGSATSPAAPPPAG